MERRAQIDERKERKGGFDAFRDEVGEVWLEVFVVQAWHGMTPCRD